MRIALIAFKDDEHTYIVCPYCSKVHRHGDVMIGQTLSSHCLSGEYAVGEALDYSLAQRGIARIKKDIERKKTAREAAKATSTVPQFPL